MIPKIIHYCWLSDDPIPASLNRYMSTWKRILPDYEFMKWDFNRFPRGKSKWVDQAFDNKKYALQLIILGSTLYITMEESIWIWTWKC